MSSTAKNTGPGAVQKSQWERWETAGQTICISDRIKQRGEYMGTPAYDRNNTRRINLKLNNKTDADIIAQLEKLKSSEGIQGYLKRLIREDMKKTGH
jgi:hypothetical protein